MAARSPRPRRAVHPASSPPVPPAGAGAGADLWPRAAQRARRGWPLALCLGLGLWLGLSRLGRSFNADGYIPSLVSLQRWTPYFWRQDRYGMLWPALLQGVRHPLLNWRLLIGCNAAASLAAQWLLVRFALGRRGPWRAGGLLAALATFALGSRQYVAEVMGPPQFFATPLALGLVGLELLAEAGLLGCTVAVALLLVAGWYNPAAPVLLGLLLCSRGVTGPHYGAARWRALLAVGALGLAFVVGRALMQRADYPQVDVNAWLPWAAWGPTARAVGRGALRDLAAGLRGPYLAWGIGLAAGVAGLQGLTAGRGRAAARRALGLGVAAAAYAALVTRQAWVAHEGSDARFLWPSCFVAVAGAGAALAATGVAWRAPRARRRQATGLGALVLAAVVGWRYGPPSLTQAGADLQRRVGASGAAAATQGCTHVAGDYWTVWPSVLYVQWQRHLTGDATPIFGLANRAEVTRPLWPPSRAAWRICFEPAARAQVQWQAQAYGMGPLRVVRASPALWVAEAAP